MAKKKQRPRANPNAPYIRQAQDATDLRYGQEGAALKMLADSAAQSYLDGRSQSKSAAASIIAAADSSRPRLADLLTRVGDYSGATTAKLAPAPGTGLHSEAAVQAANLGLTAQSAMSQLEKEKTRAVQAAAYQTGKLRDDYKSDLSKIQERGLSLQQEAGTYAADTLSKLLDAKADRHVEYTKARLTRDTATNQSLAGFLKAGIDPETGAPIKGGVKDPEVIRQQEEAKQSAKPPKAHKAAPGTPGAANQASVTKFNDSLAKAESTARALKTQIENGRVTPDQAIALITDGRKKTVYVPATDATGRPVLGRDGKPKMVAQQKNLEGVGDPIIARAAVEIALHGGVSPDTTGAIHRKGIRVRDVGVETLSKRQIQADVEKRARKQRDAKKKAAASNPIKDFYDRLNGK